MTQVQMFIHNRLTQHVSGIIEYLHSHSALSSCPYSTQPQPAHPG